MKTVKRFFCIFMAVLVIFFSINNSYFSPHKMDTVEATSIVVGGGVVITADLVIKLIGALVAAGLSIGLIVEWQDMDFAAVLVDLHDWLQENIEVLDSIMVDGTSALKEWAMGDEWTVIEGGASNPEPSPDGNGKSDPWWKKLIGNVPDTVDVMSLSNLVACGTIALESFVNQAVTPDEAYTEVAEAYLADKIDNFDSVDIPLDPITEALNYRFSEAEGYFWNKDYEMTDDGSYSFKASIRFADTFNGIRYFIDSSIKNFYPTAVVYDSSINTFLYYQYKNDEIVSFKFAHDADIIGSNGSSVAMYHFGDRYEFPLGSSYEVLDYNFNVPVFATYEAMQAYFLLGDDSGILNNKPGYNYIDTEGDYGWASSAALSPGDLLSSFPELAALLGSKGISLASLANLIDELALALEAQNPNAGSDDDPVVYPDVPTYTEILKQVIQDTLPDVEPVTEPDPEPNPGTGTETGKDYTGLIGTIINILRNILQAIKDFMAWFIIDVPGIKAHALAALEAVPAYTSFEPILLYIDDFIDEVSNGYEYPVISMTTPDILRPYYNHDLIILVDFEDYAEYFILTRTAMSFAIIFGLFIWIVKDVQVSFTLN